jgi:hypothetical protein
MPMTSGAYKRRRAKLVDSFGTWAWIVRTRQGHRDEGKHPISLICIWAEALPCG